MEGDLELWEGVAGIGGWTRKYFIMSDSVMLYLDRKGGSLEGKVHLEVASLDRMMAKDRQFGLETGLGFIKLRARTPHLKGEWLKVMLVK